MILGLIRAGFWSFILCKTLYVFNVSNSPMLEPLLALKQRDATVSPWSGEIKLPDTNKSKYHT